MTEIMGPLFHYPVVPLLPLPELMSPETTLYIPGDSGIRLTATFPSFMGVVSQ